MTPEPILPGFYPDPTICRVGEDYYLAQSSFEYCQFYLSLAKRQQRDCRQLFKKSGKNFHLALVNQQLSYISHLRGVQCK